MRMELSPSVCYGLSLIKNDEIDKQEMLDILAIVKNSLIGQDFIPFKNGLTKLIVLAIASLFIESSRLNKGLKEEVEEVELVLKENNVDKNFAHLIIGEFKKLSPRLKNRLNLLKLQGSQEDLLNHLVDVNWRQDIIIRSRLRENICDLDYLIELKSREENKDNITFSTDVQGLQDLVHKLKECCKTIENVFTNIR